MTLTQQLSKPQPVKQIAKRVVNECLMVQPNEQVTVFSWDHTLDYASSVAFEVEQAGGIATTILQMNDLYWRYLKEVPEAQYARRQKGFLSLLDQTDAWVQLGGPKDPSLFPTVPDERLGKMVEGGKAVGDKFVERGIRVLNLPIGLVTPERARTYGFDFQNWQRVTTNSLDVDHAKISALSGKVESKLRNANSIRITAANGTDLTLRLKNRPVHIHDGIIDKSDLDKGTRFETLPAGAIEVAPDEASAEGMVLFDQPTALAGKMLTGLQLKFENGRLTSYTAQSNFDAFKGTYEKMSGDKDRLANVVIGLNPRAELIGFFTDRIVQGTVSIGIGGNKGIGGTNETQFGHEETLRKPTLTVDGYKLVDQGKIQT
jgi:leucyl aminopeptidase (aminopeptidase T)